MQHCVNAFDRNLFLAVERGEAEIVDEKGGRIGWRGFASHGQRSYVRFLSEESEAEPPPIDGREGERSRAAWPSGRSP